MASQCSWHAACVSFCLRLEHLVKPLLPDTLRSLLDFAFNSLRLGLCWATSWTRETDTQGRHLIDRYASDHMHPGSGEVSEENQQKWRYWKKLWIKKGFIVLYQFFATSLFRFNYNQISLFDSYLCFYLYSSYVHTWFDNLNQSHVIQLWRHGFCWPWMAWSLSPAVISHVQKINQEKWLHVPKLPEK